MKFQTHNDADLNIDGTSWTFSTIQATFNELVTAFGEPIQCDSKVPCMWVLKFEDDTRATVYLWKQSVTDPTTPMTWNIGGDMAQRSAGHVTSLVHNAFREAHCLSARSVA
jgi:hypothetical protein